MDTIDGNTPGSTAPTFDLKQLSTIRAKLAILGHELHVVTKDGRTLFEVRRWGMCRTCSTVHDLEGFLVQITGAKHGVRS